MPGKLLPYLLIFLLIFTIVGCTELWKQSASTHNRSRASETVKTRSAGNDMDIKYKESVKQKIKDVKDVKDSKREVYLVDINDVLDIVVFEDEDLSVTLRVSEKGTISYPLVGEMQVKGLTAYEVEKALEKRLKDGDYLKKPEVSVRLDIELMGQYSEKEVFVMGEVKEPGPVSMVGKYLTVLEAVARAGGFTEFAAPNRTTIVRIEYGVEKAIKVDLNKVRKGDKALDITLRAGDIVIIPETYF
ncbi:MAG: polysaccharide biosynthesis/export family protein [Candidatus Scalindua sediminis]|nr:polysaccharide biosynthesis/export family protein [Candidatus Scalindua sediminis]